MQSEPSPQATYDSQDYTQMQFKQVTANNSTATSLSIQQFHQNHGTPQQRHNASQNISETSSPYIDSQDIGDDEDDGDDSPFDMALLGRIDVKDLTVAQKRRLRRNNLKKKFNTMKKGNFWQIQSLQDS